MFFRLGDLHSDCLSTKFPSLSFSVHIPPFITRLPAPSLAVPINCHMICAESGSFAALTRCLSGFHSCVKVQAWPFQAEVELFLEVLFHRFRTATRSALVLCDSLDEILILHPMLSCLPYTSPFDLPSRLAAVADALLGTVNID
jgi:hypothetical protein